MSFSEDPNLNATHFNPIRVVDPGSPSILDHYIRPGGAGITWDDLQSPPPLPSAGNMYGTLRALGTAQAAADARSGQHGRGHG
jgi:hypothetical protein